MIVAIAAMPWRTPSGSCSPPGRGGSRDRVVKNSVAQVAAFLFPPLVLCSFLFNTPPHVPARAGLRRRDLLTAIVLWQITGDGEATVFEGVALIAMYVTLGAYAWLD